MHHLIYSSAATIPLSEEELQSLLTKASARNKQLGITGVLLYHDGEFMQLLEGDADVIHDLYKTIEQDPRHTNVLKLADKAIEFRSFPDWSMAFKTLEAEEFAQLQGYRSPASLNLAPQGLSGADALLLDLMRTYMLLED
jgi:hypothetical protein